ncbi:non-intrinsic ABC protein 4 isoform X2 [Wolffia australiana]
MAMASSRHQSSSSADDDEAFEHTLLVVREVSVYKIPPRSSSGGYKCGEWLQSDKIWSGRLRVVSCRDRCEIRLEDPNSGDLFAACFFLPGQRESSVETVLDSSRYFVLKIEDGRGKHAFVGLGFAERNEAFDFNVALSDHDKHARRLPDKEPDDVADHVDIHPAVNHRLKEGETIRINVKNKAPAGTGMLSAAAAAGKAGGGGKIRVSLPPPPNDPAATRMAMSHPPAAKRASSEPLSDLSSLGKNLPTSSSTTGWAAF